MKPQQDAVQKRWRVALWLAVSLAMVTVLIPGRGLQWLSVNVEWFDQFLRWMDAVKLGLDPVHAVMFAVLGYLTVRAYEQQRSVVILAWLAAFGAASEIAQFWIPGRHARLSDFVADVVAAAVGIGVARLLGRKVAAG